MDFSKRVFQNSSTILIGRVLGMGLSFAASIFLVRSLGSEGFGQYAFIYAYLTLFGWLVSFGTDNILVREASKSPEKANEIWSNGLLMQLILSCVAFFAMIVIAIGLDYGRDAIYLLIIGAFEFILLVPWRLVSRVFQVELQQWRAVLATLTRQVVWLGIIIVLATHSASLETILLARTLTAFLEVGLMWTLARPFFRLEIHPNLVAMKRLLLLSWPLAITALSVSVYHRIDRVLIGRYLNAGELGYYATADNLVGMMSMVPLAFMASIYPLLCQRSEQLNSVERISNISFRWLLSGSVGLAGLLFLVGQPLIVLLYGEEFAFSGEILRVLVWAQVAVCYGIIITPILLSANLQNYLTIAAVTGAIFNAIGNILILPLFGVIGAAWVTVFSYSLASIIIFAIVPATRTYGQRGLIILIKALTIGIISLKISTYLRMFGDIITGVLFIGMFFIGLLIMGLIDKSDVRLLRAVIPLSGTRIS